MNKNVFLALALAATSVSGFALAQDSHVGHQKAPGAQHGKHPTVVTVGKYQIELRVPEEGLFSGEQVDVEFRLSDLTQNDPIEGKKGVPNAKPSATVTMPSMPGMPVQRPKIHTEGIPGDYGIELYFPHGGEYQIVLTLTPPNEKPIKAVFRVDVQDEEAKKTAPKRKPYAVQVLDFPKNARAGQPVPLKLAIKETKTGQRVKSFDVAHTKLFHLIIVSKDLGWFLHEHPVPQPDGTFTISQRFPAGGEYLVFADVAPKNRGSQVISTKVKVDGPVGTWTKKLTPTKGTSRDAGIVASFRPMERPIPIGKTTTLAFNLRNVANGKPVTDLETYLGAHGHLMIINREGDTFVHSHPAEDAAALKLIRKGEVRFTARFPKAGTYKAWGQFQRGGKIATVPFVFEVK